MVAGMSTQHTQRFWRVDLIDLVREWASDMSTFLRTALMFVVLSLPVIIPMLILWYLSAIDWQVSP